MPPEEGDGPNHNSSESYEYEDTIGHGTHVAGTIAGSNVGVAPYATILAGKVCGFFGCSVAAILAAVNWGIEENVDVMNLSLGGPMSSSAMETAFNTAYESDIVVVAASGNNGSRAVSYPAGYESVIAVGAVNSDLQRAKFSQWGDHLNIVAPGQDVPSAVPVGKGRGSEIIVSNNKNLDITSRNFNGSHLGEVTNTEVANAGLALNSEELADKNLTGKIALIKRGGTTFRNKIVNVQAAGAVGAIIYNNIEGPLIGAGFNKSPNITIPVVVTDLSDGKALLDMLKTNQPPSDGEGTVEPLNNSEENKEIEEPAGNKLLASIRVFSTNYDSYNGTSMASPHIAGVVALVRAKKPSLSVNIVRSLLDVTATAIGGEKENEENQYGRGITNARSAVELAELLN